MFTQTAFRILFVLIMCIGLSHQVYAQVSTQEFENLKNKVDGYAPMAMVLFLFGVFCALWAQNTRRNPWIWFFFGLFFNVITVVFVLIKNADDINVGRR